MRGMAYTKNTAYTKYDILCNILFIVRVTTGVYAKLHMNLRTQSRDDDCDFVL